MERIKEVPVIGPVINIFDTYPRISAWVILSAGIIILLLLEARDVGLTVGNWIALIIASIIVAGLSIWIVSWEDEEETGEAPVLVKSEAAPTSSEDVALRHQDVVSEDVAADTSDDDDAGSSDDSGSDSGGDAGGSDD